MVKCSTEHPGRTNNPMPRSSKDKGRGMKNWLYDVGVQVCCCAFIGMYLSMSSCFRWRVFYFLYTNIV